MRSYTTSHVYLRPDHEYHVVSPASNLRLTSLPVPSYDVTDAAQLSALRGLRSPTQPLSLPLAAFVTDNLAAAAPVTDSASTVSFRWRRPRIERVSRRLGRAAIVERLAQAVTQLGTVLTARQLHAIIDGRREPA